MTTTVSGNDTITYGTVLRYGTSEWTVMVVATGTMDGRPIVYMTTLVPDHISGINEMYKPGSIFKWVMGKSSWQVVE